MKIERHNDLRPLTPRPDERRVDRSKLKNACDDFEALFISRLLKEMRKTTAEGSGYSTQKYASTFQSLFDWEISRMLARRGSMGISRNLMKSVENEIVSGESAANRCNFDGLIDDAAACIKLDHALIRSVIACESGGDPNLVSRRNAKGLMQLMDETANDLGIFDPFDPAQNIYGGTAYLRQLLDSFDQNLELSLAAYNAGPNAVRKHNGIPPYPETINYVDRVMNLYRASQSETNSSFDTANAGANHE